MNTKLTLTIEETIIGKAKEYAASKGRSLSELVENYFKVITKEESIEETELTPLVKSLLGSFKAPESFDYKEELTIILTEKHQ